MRTEAHEWDEKKGKSGINTYTHRHKKRANRKRKRKIARLNPEMKNENSLSGTYVCGSMINEINKTKQTAIDRKRVKKQQQRVNSIYVK